MSAAEHEVWMLRALELARQGWGMTHPGPMVGALIVEDGHIVAEGSNGAAGTQHAAKAALAKLGRAPSEDATLVLSLEPGTHDGRPGEDVEWFLGCGLKRIVVGASHPHPEQAGRGCEALRAAGIEVVTGLLETECMDLNLIYNHWVTHGTPLVAAKAAITLDGRVACRSGDSKDLTGEAAQADEMRWRRLFPSIAVGADTVIATNPRLTARVPGEEEWCPWRFVFDGLLRSVADRAMPDVYTDYYRERTIVVTTPHGGMGYVRKLQALGVKVWILPSGTQRVPMAEFRKRCVQEQIGGVFFEGGSPLVSQIMQERQLDYLFVYRAPVLLADDRSIPVLSGLRTEKLMNAIRLADVEHGILGHDTLTRGRVVYPAQMHVDEANLASGNAHKAVEFAALVAATGLPLEIVPARGAFAMPAVVEDAGTFGGNARKKARALHAILPAGSWVLADDSGLCVDALGGAPGVESAYFAGPQGDSAANLRKLVERMREVPAGRRQAHFVCVLLLLDGQGAEFEFEGRCPGALRETTGGNGGFGYDPLFVPDGQTRTFAELPEADKNALSHRGRAWAQLAAWLRARLAQ